MKPNNLSKFLLLFIILISSYSFISCDFIDNNNNNNEFRKDTVEKNLKTDIKVVKLNKAKSVDVEILMGAGLLKINDGANKLLEAGFAYTYENFKAKINYKVIDEKGTLKIIQPSTNNGYKIKNYKNIWDLRFNNKVPMTMLIKFGAGEANVNLGNLLIKDLDFKLGAGKANIDLKSSKILKKLVVNMGVGDVLLDLTGEWNHNLDVTIDGGIGKLTILLPKEVGVKANVKKGLTDINAQQFIKDGNIYYNKAYDENKPFIDLDINTGIGQVNLKNK